MLFGIPRRTKYPEIVQSKYEAIRETFQNNLPHVSTVRSWYANSDMNADPGLSPTCLSILEEKANSKKSEGKKVMILQKPENIIEL